ncbi:MAG: substrate-binding domain-containing protein [Hyphomicrobium sp.]|nr:substrate-binding domain-containing protein [Hyphomicrobium sp.]
MLALAAVSMLVASNFGSYAADRFIILQSTTSTENSGLFNFLLPQFTARSGIEVRVVAVGTGQAIKNAENGDGDVLLVHDRAAEEKFVADGHGVKRFDVMYNDFVLIGSKSDPAKIAGTKDVAAALQLIAAAHAPFVSRGDDSGTHKAEMRLWKAAGVDAKAASGTWYREAGQGMGATLNVASGMGAYVLADRATWSSFKNRGDLAVLIEGDTRLFNPYGVIAVNPSKHPRVKAADAQAFVDWMISEEGQSAIAAFKIEGEPPFFPNARAGGE